MKVLKGKGEDYAGKENAFANFENTAREVYGVPMQKVPMTGGSGPNYPFVHDLGLPVATAGMGYPETRAHAPNENIRIDLYLKHAKHMVRVIREFAK